MHSQYERQGTRFHDATRQYTKRHRLVVAYLPGPVMVVRLNRSKVANREAIQDAFIARLEFGVKEAKTLLSQSQRCSLSQSQREDRWYRSSKPSSFAFIFDTAVIAHRDVADGAQHELAFEDFLDRALRK